MKRRSFLAAPVLAGLAAEAYADVPATEDTRVFATADGVPHTPEMYSTLLQKLAPNVTIDDYSNGGTVGELEAKVAAALGKETAVWLPTGTLANHLAVRLLAGEKRRVLVQQECHLYNDCGDCCQTLSGLHMVPLAPGKATFTVEDAEAAAERSASGRVMVPIGAMQIETPVRRRTGEAFDFAEMQKISQWARGRKIGLHLDGARLYIASAYSGVPVRAYAALFDTVYISMYKYFNAASGAILAGPKALLEDLFHTRRMFGGGLHRSWLFAAAALYYFDRFEERYARAVRASEKVISTIQSERRLDLARVPNGTNIFWITSKTLNPQEFQQRLQNSGITLGAPSQGRFAVSVNETWNRVPPEEISARFLRALG
jgi:threonine aldolase